jgi:hypothetical protein
MSLAHNCRFGGWSLYRTLKYISPPTEAVLKPGQVWDAALSAPPSRGWKVLFISCLSATAGPAILPCAGLNSTSFSLTQLSNIMVAFVILPPYKWGRVKIDWPGIRSQGEMDPYANLLMMNFMLDYETSAGLWIWLAWHCSGDSPDLYHGFWLCTLIYSFDL